MLIIQAKKIQIGPGIKAIDVDTHRLKWGITCIFNHSGIQREENKTVDNSTIV